MLALVIPVCAQGEQGAQDDDRWQYPEFLSRTFVGVNVGALAHKFTNEHLPAGFRAAEKNMPKVAPRVTLLGYRLTDNFSARITYMRPVHWPAFVNINGDNTSHSMWMNVGGLTLKARTTPKARRPSFYAETGLGLITRKGFEIDGKTVVQNASYAGVLAGGGVEIPLTRSLSAEVNLTRVPGKRSVRQPHAIFAGTGILYHIRPLPQERVEHNRSGGYIFPKNLVQAAYVTNSLGYGVTRFLSEGAVPLFWGGEVEVRRGAAVNYQRNVFHTRRVFSFDLGASIGHWQSSRLKQRFSTLSVYPLARFTAIRTKVVDAYFNFSMAGPTLISRVHIDDADTGRSFTFRDYMGIGIYAGKAKRWNAEWNIGHFSNGNIFPANAGVKIPLTVYLGYAF